MYRFLFRYRIHSLGSRNHLRSLAALLRGSRTCLLLLFLSDLDVVDLRERVDGRSRLTFVRLALLSRRLLMLPGYSSSSEAAHSSPATLLVESKVPTRDPFREVGGRASFSSLLPQLLQR